MKALVHCFDTSRKERYIYEISDVTTIRFKDYGDSPLGSPIDVVLSNGVETVAFVLSDILFISFED